MEGFNNKIEPRGRRGSEGEGTKTVSSRLDSGDQVELVNPVLMTARTSSSDTPRRLSIS
jgi:hypothetical protein